jgi:ATP-binding cassette subfamily F protein 3
MLQLTDAGKRFGPRTLFEDANWLITPQERTGLVGGNGTGKSTLLKVLAGIESLDYGTVQRTRGMTIGYLPQDGLALTGRTIFEECLSVFAATHALEREMQELSAQMAVLDPTSPEYTTVSHKFAERNDQFHAKDGYALDAQVGAVLGGLGFSKEDWSRRTEEFSGGWQMRIALAKLLLEKPNLLLLDEPTNHLDLETRNWLEDYLHNYPNAFVLISHDRYFLDVTVNKTVEIWNKRVHFYSGNYERYLTQKNDRRLQLEAAYRNQREHIEHLESFISRFRAQATKAKQVQSRVKELEKIERIELPQEEDTIHFTFPQPPPSGRTVLEAAGIGKNYGEKHVLANVNFTITRGDRIALIGPNGAGKSTLIRLLAAQEPPTEGSVKLGHNVLLDTFAQDQYKALDANARMLDDITGATPRIAEVTLRSLLGCFLFSGDDVFKRLGVLSGGERNRYALARMLVSPANFLLLDEPTNHLDLRAKDVLLEALREFTGTVVFVSHDRYFIDGLATSVFEVEHGGVQVFPGNYADYLYRKQAEAASATAPVPAKSEPQKNPTAATAPAATEFASNNNVKRLNPIKLRQMQERCAFLEEELPRVEASMSLTEQALCDFVSAEETARQTVLLESLRAQHESMMAEWEEIAQTLEEQTQRA